jgi:tetratricopeptide (TPR) repeat protein
METKIYKTPTTPKTSFQLFADAKSAFSRKDSYAALGLLNQIKNKTKEHLLLQASCLNSMHKSDQAIKILNTMERDYDVIRCLAFCEETLGNYDKAIHSFEQLYNDYGKEFDLIALADCCLLRQQPGDKERAFKILSSLKGNLKAQMHLGHYYIRFKQFENAFNVFLYVKKRWPKDPQGYLALARWYDEAGQYEDSIKTYKSIDWPIKFSNLQKKEVGLGFSYEHLGKYKEALQHFGSVNSIQSKLAMGRCYKNNNEPQRAINEIYLPLHHSRKKDPSVVLPLALTYHELSDYKNAIKFFELAQTFSLSYDQKIDVALGLNRSYQAQADIEKNPEEKDKGYQKAIDIIEQILISLPTNQQLTEKRRELKLGLAFTNQRKKNYTKAEEIFQELLKDKQASDYSIVLLGSAYCYKDDTKYEQAISGFKAYLARVKEFGSKEQLALLALGACYLQTKQYESAYKLFDEVLNTEKDNWEALLGQAQTYQAQGNTPKALEKLNEFHKLQLTNEDAQVKAKVIFELCKKKEQNVQEAEPDLKSEPLANENNNTSVIEQDLLGILLKNAEYDKAIDLIQKLLKKNQNNPDLLLTLADCYRRQGKYKSALHIYSNLPNFDQLSWDKKMDMIHCYQDLGHFDEVIKRVLFILKTNPEHADIKYTLGRAYEKTERYDEALAIYNEITPSFKRDLFIAGCYREMGNFIESEKIYNKYWEDALKKNDTHRIKELYLAFGVYYEKMDNYNQAISVYTEAYSKFTLTDAKQLQIQKSLALCFAKMGNEQEMLEWIKLAFDFSVSEREEIQRWLVRCYYSLGSYQEVIDTVLALKEFSNPPYEKLNLAGSYELLKLPLEKVEKIYQEITTNFPNFCAAHYHYCIHLIRHNHNKALLTIKDFENKWPSVPKLYLLKFHYAVTKKIPSPDMILKEAIHRFPYFIKAFLDLIEYYTQNNRMGEAEALRAQAWARFPGHPKFKNFAPTVKLSSDVKNAFNSLKDIKGTSYLTGTAIHQLIDPFAYSDQTIELVVLLEQGAEFSSKGYFPLPCNPQIYQRKEQDYLINCYISPETNLEKDAQKRDFTLFTLYCNEAGGLIDPTGLGLEHVKARILDTVNDPVALFNSTPVCIFLACRYMAWGYTPSDRVHEAMKNFTFKDKTGLEYLKSLVREDFSNLVLQEKYVTKLMEYNLLKILGIDNADQLLIDDLLSVLQTQLCLDNHQSISTVEPKIVNLTPQLIQPKVNMSTPIPLPIPTKDLKKNPVSPIQNKSSSKKESTLAVPTETNTNPWASANNPQRLFNRILQKPKSHEQPVTSNKTNPVNH